MNIFGGFRDIQRCFYTKARREKLLALEKFPSGYPLIKFLAGRRKRKMETQIKEQVPAEMSHALQPLSSSD